MNVCAPVQKVAVYSTVYPGAEMYLPDWYRSLRAQSDGDFRLWIGLDGIGPKSVEEIVGTRIEATWVHSQPGDTPTQIRQRALEQIAKTYDVLVLVDSDDILHETRVAAAREAMKSADLIGCALSLVDQQGNELGQALNLPSGTTIEELLPRHNVFGFSNTAYRSELLLQCLPVPVDVSLMDWYLATKAWLMGARISFDPIARMNYRQHETNVARVRFPISSNQVAQDTESVRRHFQFVLSADPGGFQTGKLAQVKRVAAEVEEFYKIVVTEPSKLLCYVQALNSLNPAPLWWVSVAHPELRSMWHAM